MVEPRRKPEDFLGVQLQVALKNGPNGTVPYLYAVFHCRGKGPTFEAVSGMDFGDLIGEIAGDDEYGYVVVRQQTSGGGCRTDAGGCTRSSVRGSSSSRRSPSSLHAHATSLRNAVRNPGRSSVC